MARKLPRLQRVLDAPALFSIAYGEIASSIYFALGIIAFHALGFTPAVLLLTGALFLVVSLSYAEGTAAIRETGGAATFVRIAFNDFWGFVTGWALFLDYLIVIALAALYVPHYAAAALFTNISKPWDVVAGCGVIAAIAAVRLLRNRRLFRFAVVIALIDLATQLLLVILGLALLFSPHALSQGTSLGSNPTWHSIAFALPLAMLAYTGLETVANLSEEVRRPGRDLPRSLFGAIGLVVLLYAAIAVVGLSAFPAGHGTPLGSTWAKAPLMGIVARLRDHLPDVLGAPLDSAVDHDFGRAQPPGLLPRRPLQLRCPARLHGGAAGRDQAALQPSGEAAAVPGAAEHGSCPGTGGRRRVPDHHRLDPRARDPQRRPLRGAGVARGRPADVRRPPTLSWRTADPARRLGRRARRPHRGAVLEHPRAPEARPDRRGDGCDGGQARAGIGSLGLGAARRPGADGPAPGPGAP